MVIRDLGAAEITIIGVRDVRFPPLFGVLLEAIDGGMLFANAPLEFLALG